MKKARGQLCPRAFLFARAQKGGRNGNQRAIQPLSPATGATQPGHRGGRVGVEGSRPDGADGNHEQPGFRRRRPGILRLAGGLPPIGGERAGRLGPHPLQRLPGARGLTKRPIRMRRSSRPSCYGMKTAGMTNDGGTGLVTLDFPVGRRQAWDCGPELLEIGLGEIPRHSADGSRAMEGCPGSKSILIGEKNGERHPRGRRPGARIRRPGWILTDYRGMNLWARRERMRTRVPSPRVCCFLSWLSISCSSWYWGVMGIGFSVCLLPHAPPQFLWFHLGFQWDGAPSLDGHNRRLRATQVRGH